MNDESCWFSQTQVNRFHEKTVQLTGNDNIAREAGRLAAAPETIGALRQYTFGLVGPSFAFQLISRLSKRLTRSTRFHSRVIKHNQVEITVEMLEGVEEQPFQCENRMGFFEAIVDGFHLGLPKIEQTECLFEGGSCCRYIITWKRKLSNILSSVRTAFLALLVLSVLPGLFVLPFQAFLYSFVSVSFLCLGASLATEIQWRKEITRSRDVLWDSSERLTESIDTNSRNIQLIQEIGQALVNKKSVDGVLTTITQVMESKLDFDCGVILLVNQDRTRLEIRSSFGYSPEEYSKLLSTSFSLNKPGSQGPFVQAFHQQEDFIINNTEEIEEKLSARSRKLVKDLGVHSFVCCPIVVEGTSLGVIAATNQATKQSLVRRDVNLLQGIAPSIGVTIQNAGLIEELHSSFEKTLKVLADSIDARDYLTAGHSEVVTEYAEGIARQLGQPDEYIQMIRIAGLLHDYGKIAVPDSILKKNGRLTLEERDIINTHPARSQQILNQVPFRGLQKQIPQIAGAHHERWDGAGYPSGLKGEEIPFGARIIAVADFFEAITSKRHYREPMPIDVALGLLHESSGTHFEPKIVTAFIAYLEARDFSLATASSPNRPHEITVGCRRKSPRVQYRTQVSVRQNQQILTGDMIDVGNKGAYIASSNPVTEKDSLILTFAIPGSDEYIQVPSKVTWINSQQSLASSNHPEGFAVHFQQIPEHAQRLMNQFIRQQISPVANITAPKEAASAS
ncbi:MAG: HD domain-containing protein [Desulfuromusa sp.]|nr:HD domain-containing protein [Desulfuromusa sp.]